MSISPLAALQESNRRAAASANWSTAVQAVGDQKEDAIAVRVQVAEWRLKTAQQQAEEADVKVARAHLQVTELIELVRLQQQKHDDAMAACEAKWRVQIEQQLEPYQQETARLASLYEEEKAAKVRARRPRAFIDDFRIPLPSAFLAKALPLHPPSA